MHLVLVIATGPRGQCGAKLGNYDWERGLVARTKMVH